jgi:prevent-host-death family protein
MTRIIVDYNGGLNMETLSLSEAKIKLSSLVDRVSDLDDEIIITKNGRPAAVLVSPEEYEGWKETISIHSDPEFIKDIKKGLKALKDRKAKLYTLEKLFD